MSWIGVLLKLVSTYFSIAVDGELEHRKGDNSLQPGGLSWCDRLLSCCPLLKSSQSGKWRDDRRSRPSQTDGLKDQSKGIDLSHLIETLPTSLSPCPLDFLFFLFIGSRVIQVKFTGVWNTSPLCCLTVIYCPSHTLW